MKAKVNIEVRANLMSTVKIDALPKKARQVINDIGQAWLDRQEEIVVFSDRLTDAAWHAFEWSSGAMRSAAIQKSLSNIIFSCDDDFGNIYRALEKEHSRLTDYLLMNLDGPTSTSAASNAFAIESREALSSFLRGTLQPWVNSLKTIT